MLRLILFYPLFLPLTFFFALVVILVSFYDSTGRFANRISLFWGGLVCNLAGVTVHVDRGKFNPSGRFILMVNHQSWFDIPVLLASLKGHQFRFVAKESLFRIPFFGQAMSRIGYIGINRSNPRRGMKSIHEAIEKSSHASILIFPEGTRHENLGEFKIGGMILAIKSERPIVPVLIAGTSDVLPRNTLRIFPNHVVVKFFPAVKTKDSYTLTEREKLKQNMWTLMHEHFKETRLWLNKIRRLPSHL
ncbi:MAG TPA: 1-acyl-sn-glycerol-3-phosphate acyltransferase [Desulfonatronum sp.]|nr:1-acyl-sn-glycerol-3-phosphate acyltransferase [Desulfonatronum sp.]